MKAVATITRSMPIRDDGNDHYELMINGDDGTMIFAADITVSSRKWWITNTEYWHVSTEFDTLDCEVVDIFHPLFLRISPEYCNISPD